MCPRPEDTQTTGTILDIRPMSYMKVEFGNDAAND